MPKFVTIDIDEHGKETLTTTGFAGAECRKASAPFLEGMQKSSDTPTAEAKVDAAKVKTGS